MDNRTETFCCTRPTLAIALIEAGFSAQKTLNPWDLRKTAWVFERTPALNQMVDDFYRSLEGK